MNETVKSCIAFARASNVHNDHGQAIEFLCIAVETLNEERAAPDPRVFGHTWTPEELAHREKLFTKTLTLDDLKRQVDAAVEELNAFRSKHGITVSNQTLPDVLPLGDFEIKRRK